jgi:hypothetical protein
MSKSKELPAPGQPEQTYLVAYKVEPGHYTKAELKDKDMGGADGLFIASILYPPDGSRSQANVSMDGRSGMPLAPDELFQVWVMLAHQLSQTPDLSEGKRRLAEVVFQSVRDAVLASRATKKTRPEG